MTRLSKMTGDYTNSGMIVDSFQGIASGGETSYPLNFVDGSEEVYINGKRVLKGPAEIYVTGDSRIDFNTPLVSGDEVILVGKASSNDIQYSRGISEKVILTDGQTEVLFTSIQTAGIELVASGDLVNGSRLVSPDDYSLKDGSTDTVVLTQSYPAGTIIEGTQHGRFSWIDPDNFVISDGATTKGLANRFIEQRNKTGSFSTEVVTGNSVTVSTSNKGFQEIVLTQSTTNISLLFNDTDDTSLYTVIVCLTQGSSNRNVTWPSNVKWLDGDVPTLTDTTGRQDLIEIRFVGGSNNIFGKHLGTYH